MALSLKNVFGFFGFILTTIYYILTSKSFLKLYKRRNNNLEGIDFYKVLFNYMASFFSYFYSDFSDYSSMVFASKFGIFFSLPLLSIYSLFEMKIDLTDAILNILMIGISSLTFYHYFRYILVDFNTYGVYFTFANIIPLFYYIYEKYNEYKNKIETPLSYYLILIYTSSAFCWFVYGFFNDDTFLNWTFGIETFCGFILILVDNYKEKIFRGYEIFGDFNEDNNKSENTIEFEEEKRKKYENI